MYLLLSGEGQSDMGACDPAADDCEGDAFKEGPMAIMVDQLVEKFQGYEMSHLETKRVMFVSEAALKKKKLPTKRKAMSLKGKKKPAETQYYFKNARALASMAIEKSKKLNDNVVAVLFRDADGTASAGRGNWQDKRNSMIKGFNDAGFDLGVAMLPKPKSEVWLLCSTKTPAHQHCEKLEAMSGNDRGNNPLKSQLCESLNGSADTNRLNQRLRNGTIDVTRIDMPSFNVFKDDLKKAVETACGRTQ